MALYRCMAMHKSMEEPQPKTGWLRGLPWSHEEEDMEMDNSPVDSDSSPALPPKIANTVSGCKLTSESIFETITVAKLHGEKDIQISNWKYQCDLLSKKVKDQQIETKAQKYQVRVIKEKL